MSSELPNITAARVDSKYFRRLINIGDQVFGLVVTDLIREAFPNLCVGPSSVRPAGVFFVQV